MPFTLAHFCCYCCCYCCCLRSSSSPWLFQVGKENSFVLFLAYRFLIAIVGSFCEFWSLNKKAFRFQREDGYFFFVYRSILQMIKSNGVFSLDFHRTKCYFPVLYICCLISSCSFSGKMLSVPSKASFVCDIMLKSFSYFSIWMVDALVPLLYTLMFVLRCETMANEIKSKKKTTENEQKLDGN